MALSFLFKNSNGHWIACYETGACVFPAAHLVLLFCLFSLDLWPNVTLYQTLIMNQFILQSWFKMFR